MILAIGEILADMVGSSENGTLTFKSFCGGAPFNVAVNAKNAGASVACKSKQSRRRYYAIFGSSKTMKDIKQIVK